MEQHTTVTQSIEDLINDIDGGSIYLPEFQRDFVWEIGKTFDLFDSLIRNIFIGSIIYGIPSFEITVKEIDKNERKSKNKRKIKINRIHFTKDIIEEKQKLHKDKFRLILDGQQRLTAIYRAMKGFDDIWFVMKNANEMSLEVQQIFLDKKSKPLLENVLYCISNEEDENRVSIKLSDIWEIMKLSPIREKFIDENYYKKTKYFLNPENKDFIEQGLDFYLFIYFELTYILRDNKLFSYYLLNMSLDKFILFFERSNTRGIWLNFIDILSAKLYVGFNLKEKLIELKENNRKHKINEEIIVRTIAYLVSSKIANGSGKGIEIGRSFILSELDAKHFVEYWEMVSNLYIKVIDFLNDKHFVLSQTWMPYENMIIPLIIFLKEIGGSFDRKTQDQFEFLEYWYWASIFSQKYTGSSNEKIIEDAKILTNIAKNNKINDKSYINKLSKIQISTFEDIYSYSKKGSAIYNGILNLINYKQNGLKDWKSTTNISFNDDKLDDHHIFPQNYVKKTFKEDCDEYELLNCVANRTLIPKTLDIQISDKMPSKYLNEIKTINPKLNESLENHLIDISILEGKYDNQFVKFVEYRAKRILNEFINPIIVEKTEFIKAKFEHFN